ncbi:TIGR03620 family F420-dependent LLM class oxidoreductase [Mycolicibacterium vaccae]|uniref:TIGR03620 family F420-dependent LLM class oxidoreductase n=1 Tax=Mycolicibacterium vaccae TaxID=1810 RepID=UPI003CEA57F3
MTRIELGRYGFCVDEDVDAAALEQSGFGALWINGGRLDRLDRLTDLLRSTSAVAVGSAIIPPDRYRPAEVAALFEHSETIAPGRLVVGLGIPHQPGALAELTGYLDALPVPRDRMLLAALGPRALELARDRFAGALPMLYTPERTAWARGILGPDRTLSVGLYAVLDEDPAAARAAAARPLSFLTTLPSYRTSLRRQGFSDTDVDDLSDRLVDALVAWGSAQQIIGHAKLLHDAGADHVALTVLGSPTQPTGVAAARLLAAESG